jgi:hypothetical protein
MLVSHASIEAALRSVVARRREMDGAQSLIRFILRECRLRGCESGRNCGGKHGR